MEKTEFEKRFAASRRELIERDFGKLNDMQRRAVMATEGPLLLLAGAGSGKTTVLINRIANLIRYGRASDTAEVPDGLTENDLHLVEEFAASDVPIPDNVRALCSVEPVEPWRIIAITFTNKAADELKARLSRMLGEQAQDIWAMTFHSACVRILRRSIEAMGLSRSFTIYDTADSAAVMKRVLKELNVDEKSFPPKAVLGYISRAKDAMLTPEKYAEEAEKGYDPRKKIIAKAYIEYSRRLRAADALDFDDLIFYTVRLLLEHEDVRSYYQRLFRYVLVDEYQDTSNLQYILASTLAGGYENICVVGDDDQSIYRFRGATIENILSFEERYKDARCIKLEQNYRSTGHILGAANAVIKNNLGRKGKELWTSAGDGDKLRMFLADNDDDEASFVCARILGGLSSGMHWGDFAVLYRMNAQSNRLEYAMKRNGIPYRIVGGTRFFDRAEIKDMTSYLCVMHNPSDDLRLLRIINNPPRGIGSTTIERLRNIASSEHRPLYDVLRDCRQYPELKSATGKLSAFCSMLEELRDASDSMELPDLYDLLLERTGYITALGTSDEALSRVDNIHELKSNIISYAQRAEEPSLGGFLDEIALYTDLDSLDPESDSVIMMTIHSAKGLEFPWVFIVGMEDGIFPSFRSIGEAEEMEEERRLCYVALTRAKKQLFLTAARHRMLFGHTSSNMISRFVEEIPPEHIDRPQPEHSREDDSRLDGDYLEYRRRESPGYSPRPSSGYSRPGAGAFSQHRTRPASPAKKAVTAAPAAALPELSVGDKVVHKAFGNGVVKALTPMPGDALLTVEFETVGEKRLMLKAAGAFMKKL
ncbi:MAG: ATP-dependent helicase [Oscillospiraceae bacterium]